MGKLISITDGNGTALADGSFAHQMAFRYRGYYYDTETGLYYLQSRYYDPETGRFLNADDVDYIGISKTNISFNAFAYCENNPISNTDPNGRIAISTILGAVFGMVFGAIGFFLDIIIDNINIIFNPGELKKAISGCLSSTKGKLRLFIDILLGGIDGALSTTNKYTLFKTIYNVINTLYSGVSSGFDVLSLVVETVITFICSKLFKTEQIFQKFNSKKISNKAFSLTSNFSKFNTNSLKSLVTVIKNQIVYYIKNNKKVYKRFIKNYALSTVVSWTSKLPDLLKAINKLAH